MESAQFNNLNAFKQNLNLLVTEPWGGWDVSYVPVSSIENLINDNFGLIYQNRYDPEIKRSFNLLKIKIRNEKISEKEQNSLIEKIDSFQQGILPSFQQEILPIQTIVTIFSLVQKNSYKEAKSLINMMSCSHEWHEFAEKKFIPIANQLLADKISFYEIEDFFKAMPYNDMYIIINRTPQVIEARNYEYYYYGLINKEQFESEINDINGAFQCSYLEQAIVCNLYEFAVKLVKYGAQLKFRCSVADMSNLLKRIINVHEPSSLKLQVALIQNGAKISFLKLDETNSLIEDILKSTDLECQDVVHTLLDTIKTSKPAWIELAAKKGWGEIACKIIDKIDKNEIEKGSYFPNSLLMSESIARVEKCGRVDILAYLIKRLAQMDSIYPLQIALEYCRNEEILNVLLEEGENLPADRSLEFLSSFHLSLVKNKYDFAYKLLDEGRIDLQKWNTIPRDNPLLMIYSNVRWANPEKFKKIVLKLIDKGAVTFPLGPTQLGLSFLSKAIDSDHTEIALAMIKNSEDIEPSNFISSLKYAIQKSMKEVAIELLKRGCVLSDNSKKEPLEWLQELKLDWLPKVKHFLGDNQVETAITEELIQHFT